MFNVDLRTKIRIAGFYNYQVAAVLGMSEQQFSRILTRREMTNSEKESVVNALEQLRKERDNEQTETD